MFIENNKDGLIYMSSDKIGAKHAFTTRLGGVSEGMYAALNLRFSCDDARENVIENYRLLCAAIGVDAERAVPTHQLHHDHIRIVTEEDAGKLFCKPRDYEDVDGLITNVAEIPLFIYSADCGITLLHDPVTRCIGAVHSGWRGVALGILPKTAEAMCRVYGAKPENIRIAMGAGIGQCCFETDSDVPDAMRDAIGAAAEPFMERRGEKWHIDLRGINVYRLRQIGISEEQIDLLPLCTACNPDLYWSHRLTGNSRGVQGAVISLGKE